MKSMRKFEILHVLICMSLPILSSISVEGTFCCLFLGNVFGTLFMESESSKGVHLLKKGWGGGGGRKRSHLANLSISLFSLSSLYIFPYIYIYVFFFKTCM